MRPAHGQASVEWIALCLLIAIVLGTAAALTWGGLGDGVAYAIRRGLCEVGGDRCPGRAPHRPDLPPCPRERYSRSQDFDLDLGFLRFGGGLGVQEERTSDGRVTVTFTNSGGAGLVGGLGVTFEVGPLEGGIGVEASLTMRFTAGRSWSFPDRRAADRFLRRYGQDQGLAHHLLDDARRLCPFCSQPPSPPPADVTYTEGGPVLSLAAGADAILGAFGAAQLSAALGSAHDRHSGERTLYLRLGGGAAAELLAAVGASAGGTVSALAQLTLDRRGRPIRLSLQAALAGGTQRTPRPDPFHPGPVLRVPQLPVLSGSGRLREIESDLDLTDPAVKRAAARTLRALLYGGGPAGESGLGALLAAHGRTTVRDFASSDEHGGTGATLALGVTAGGDYTHTRQGLGLQRVWTRLPGLGFLPRADCTG